MKRVVFHIDVNSAFLSWTAIKILNEGGTQDIRTVPSVVSGDPSDRRSIITAASIPAKKIGIKVATPVSMALRTFPNLVIVRGDFDWYRKCSKGFIAICRSYSPVLEQFSIDECFLDMTFRLFGKDPVSVATALKDEIKAKLGFTVNVGVGSNKLLAKMASDFEKPDKVHTLWTEEVREKMWPLGVRDLLWVGRKTEEKLLSYGIRTIGQLAQTDISYLRRIVGERGALQLHETSNGIDNSPVETEHPDAKSYSAERTFPKDLSEPKDIDRALFKVACIVCHRIRKDKVKASTVSIFIKFTDFSTLQKQCSLPQPTDITALILNAARGLLTEIWDGERPLRQVGLGLSKLSRDAAEQMSLFEDPKLDFYRKWDENYDKENSK
ncbi:MAG: DNA polymerase IV [Bacteroidales bacterium]|nr:DNA polymerase IV [Bacteroidales bacterium]